MAFTKISEDIIENGGVTPLPDSPQLQPAALKAKFDEKGQAACLGVNNLIDEMGANTAAAGLGAKSPTGFSASSFIQAIIDAMAVEVNLNKASRHQHVNKETLDGITSELLTAYNRLVTLLTNITTVAGHIENSEDEIPTSRAVYQYIEGYDFASKLMLQVYPVGSVYYSQLSTNPQTYFGGEWERISTEGGIYGFARTA